MKRKIILLTGFIIIAVLAGLAGRALAMPTAPTVPTTISYQGYLTTSSGQPLNETVSLRFRLYGAASGGSPLWEETYTGIAISKGYFSVQLGSLVPLTPDLFSLPTRYLEVGVKRTGMPDFENLPRQALSSAPYAMQAAAVPWSGIRDMPPGFADGLDGVDYQGVVVVAKSGGDFDTITAALNSIASPDADNRFLVYVAPGTYIEQVTMIPFVDIQGSGEGTTTILWHGGPDIYSSTVDGADNAQLRNLSVESDGSGKTYATAIYSHDSNPEFLHVSALAHRAATLNTAIFIINGAPRILDVSAAALDGGTGTCDGIQSINSNLFATNSSVQAFSCATAYGIENGGASPRLNGIQVLAKSNDPAAGIATGVRNLLNTSAELSDMRIEAYGGHTVTGIENNYSNPVLSNIYVKVVTGTDSIGINNTYAELKINNLILQVEGTTKATGIYNLQSTLTLAGVNATVMGATSNIGLDNEGGSAATLQNSSLVAKGGSAGVGVNNFGTLVVIDNSRVAADAFGVAGTGDAFINNSQITGDSNTIYLITGATGSVNIAGSMLSGGPTNVEAGSINCVNVTDETYLNSYTGSGTGNCPP